MCVTLTDDADCSMQSVKISATIFYIDGISTAIADRRRLINMSPHLAMQSLTEFIGVRSQTSSFCGNASQLSVKLE